MNKKISQSESKISQKEKISKEKKSNGRISLRVETEPGDEKFAILFHASPVAMSLATIPEGRLIDVNQAWLDLVGISNREDVFGKTTVELGLVPDVESGEWILSEFKQNGLVENAEIIANTKIGDRIFLLVNIKEVEIDGIRCQFTTSENITAYKVSQEALKQIEERLSALVNSIPDEVWFADTDKKITIVNPSVLREFGSSIFDNPDVELFASNLEIKRADGTSRPVEEAPLLRALKGEIIINEEEIIRIPARNEYRYRMVDAGPVRNSEGNIIGSVSVVRDFTDRRKVEEALRKSNQLNRSILESVSDSFIALDKDWRFIYANRKALEYVGKKPDQLIGKIIWELFPSIVGKPLEAFYREVMETRKSAVLINQSNVATDKIFELHAYPLDEGLAVYGQDITDRRKAEIKLKMAQDKLNLALEKGNIGLWEWDLKTGEANMDDWLERMFGLEPGTFGKTYDAFEGLVNEEDLSHIRTAIKNAVEKDLPYETVFRINSENKKIRYLSSKGLINKDKDGKPVSMTGICFDVTGLKEGTEELISKLNEELLRSNKELQSFAYVASHDLQEPLRMVSSFTQLLAKQYSDKLDDRALEYINFAVEGSKRMYDLLNGLLAYSRINTRGKEFTDVDLTQVLEGATKNLSLIIEEKGAVVNSGALPVVNGDANQMIQLFQNLLSNSIKFSPGSPRIYISAKSNHDHFLISVRDEGMGIEPQYFEKIFQIFQRLHLREQYEGTGIGLAICKRIIERHGGKIWVESEPGNGSEFFFSIPKKR